MDNTNNRGSRAEILLTQDAILPGIIKPRHLVPQPSSGGGQLYYSDGTNFKVADVYLKINTTTSVLSILNNLVGSSTVGIGTNNPSATLDIVQNSDSPNDSIHLTNYGVSPFIVCRFANGSLSAPTAVLLNDTLGNFRAGGYNGTIFTISRGQFNILAAENWTSTANGTYLTLTTTLIGTTTRSEKMRITDSGNVGINNTTPKSKLSVVGLSVFANNAAAVAGGLAAGDFYRTGGDPDLVCVVH